MRQFAAWLAPETVAAGSAGGWKAELLRRGLSPATVNSKLAGLNRFFRFLGWMDCTVKPLRLQRRLFRSPDRELSRAEYGRLLSAARGLGRERLGLLMEAICATGIRVSEVKYLTMEAARRGRAEVSLKGKIRTIRSPVSCAASCCNTGGHKKSPPARFFSPEAAEAYPESRCGRR